MHASLLRSLPNLQEARVLLFEVDEDLPEPREPIDVPQLRRLYVNDERCLDYLRAPGLQAIALWPVDTSYHSLERFLTRSSCSPRRLKLFIKLCRFLGAPF